MPRPKKSAEPPARARDRDGTARAILAAAKEVLAEAGFQTFGVNAIARQAGCDKQLIYRYFGGLEGVCDAIGADLASDLTEQLKPLSGAAPPRTYGALMQRLALGLLDLLRRDRLMQQINAWEAAAPSPLVKRLVAARAKRLSAWMMEMRGDLVPPAGVDAPAVNAILIAAVQQLAVSAAANGAFSGIPLQTEAHWQRVRETFAALARAIYGE